MNQWEGKKGSKVMVVICFFLRWMAEVWCFLSGAGGLGSKKGEDGP